MKHLLLTFTLAACAATPAAEPHPYTALDGDTISVGSGPHIRLARIDAPELPGHCRPGRHCVPGDPYRAKAYLQFLLDQGGLVCHDSGRDYYHGRLAECDLQVFYGDRSTLENISDLMLASGLVEEYRR